MPVATHLLKTNLSLPAFLSKAYKMLINYFLIVLAAKWKNLTNNWTLMVKTKQNLNKVKLNNQKYNIIWVMVSLKCL